MTKLLLFMAIAAITWPVFASDPGQRDSLSDARERNQLQRDISSDRATVTERRQALERSQRRDDDFDDRLRHERQLERSQRQLKDSQRSLRERRRDTSP